MKTTSNHFFQILCPLVLAVFLGFFSNMLRDNPLPLFEPLAEPSIKLISCRQAKLMMAETTTIFVDARSKRAFHLSRIRGAESLPIKDFQSAIPRVGTLLLGKDVIVYCGGPQCRKAEKVARLLAARGYGPVFAMKDGLSGWTSEGYPTE